MRAYRQKSMGSETPPTPSADDVLEMVKGLLESDGSAQLKLRVVHQLLTQYLAGKPLQNFSRLLWESEP
ncbi:MAG TPA: hypothetical protein VKB51_09440 [bacterium]|nr:hypothetical protein [bacterium]